MQRISTRLLVAASFVLYSVQSLAQQDPYYAHYMLNKLAYNPAVAGEKNAICANLLTHQQWLGQKDQSAKFHTEAGGLEYYPGVNPATNTMSITAPFLKENQLGVGLQAIQDKLAYLTLLEIKLSVAYKHNFGKKLPNGMKDQIIAGGIDVGVFQGTIDGTKLNPLMPGDPNIPTKSEPGMSYNLGLGVYYTNQTMNNLYAGISVTHLVPAVVQMGPFPYTPKQHLYFLAGTKHPVGANMALLPSVLVKSDFAKTQVDLSARLEINQKFIAGLGFRSGDAMSLLLGYYILPQFYAGYAYDVNVFSPATQYTTAGTHEIFLSYCFDLNPKPEPAVRPRFNTRYLEGYTF